MNRAEFHFNVAIADWLNGLNRHQHWNKPSQQPKPFPGLLSSHFATAQNAEDAAYLKMMGLHAGMPDIPNFWRNPDAEKLQELSFQHNVHIPLYQCMFLELKQHPNKLESSQKKIQGICHYLGIPYEVAYTDKEVIAAYKKHGLEPQNTAIRDHRPRAQTEEEKQQGAFDYRAPCRPKD